MPEISDETWAEVARASRAALALLGHEITNRCLPDEPAPCGASFALHACAHLTILKVIADHQLWHLDAPASMIREIYGHERGELESRCGDHA